MDQNTVTALAAVVGSGGLSGALVQYIALRKEKLAQKQEKIAQAKWRADMEARLSKIEDESPSAVLQRLEEVEGVRESDKREMYRVIQGLRTAMRNALDSLAEIQQRLKIPSV